MSIIFPVFLSTTVLAVSAQTDTNSNAREKEITRHFAQTQSIEQQKLKTCTDIWEAKVAADKESRQTNPSKPPLTREDYRKAMANCLSAPPTTSTPR
jgi:hypothetical protein